METLVNTLPNTQPAPFSYAKIHIMVGVGFGMQFFGNWNIVCVLSYFSISYNLVCEIKGRALLKKQH